MRLCAAVLGLVVLLLTLLGLVVGPAGTYAQTEEWSTPINLSNTPSKSWIPAVTADSAGNVHVVWGEWLDKDDGDWGDAIFYTMWDGESWSEPNDILITPNGTLADLPAIAADSQGRLHVVWEAQSGIYYSQAWVQDGPWQASAWSAPVAISEVGRGRADIAIDQEDTIHVVWIDPPLEPAVLDGELCRDCWDVHYARSSDGGRTWSTPVNLSDSPERAAYPFVTTDAAGAIHVAWDEHDAADQAVTGRYSRSLDGGATWSVPRDLKQEGVTGRPYRFYVDLGAGDQVYTTWQLWHAPGLFLRSSQDGGSSWSPVVELPDVVGQGSYSYLETAGDSAGDLFVAFSAGPYGNRDVYAGQWGDGAWERLDNVSNSAQHAHRPRLVVTGGNTLHLVGFEHTDGQATIHDEGNMEIWYSRLETGAPHRPPAPLPTRPPATPAPESVSRATATPVPTPTRTPSSALAGSSPTPRPNPDLAIAAGIGAALTVLGLIVVGRMVRIRRSGS
jgi:hypothetical protein